MDLELSDDQVALRDGLAHLLCDRFDSERIRAGFDREMWDELDAAGVIGLRRDGFGWADATVVFECLGTAAVPGPLVAGTVLGDPELGLADRWAGGVVGILERPGPGEPAMVEHLGSLDALVVLDADGVAVVDPAELDGVATGWPLDPLTPVHQVDVVPTGERLGDTALAAALAERGAVLTAAFQLGMAQRLTDMAVAYASEREQFGRPIGSFQAIKHVLADMLVRTEVARAAVYAAGVHLDEDHGPRDRSRAVSGAKALAGEAAIANGRAATQVFGGMGFTWEVDVHLYLKRAWVLDTHFGSAAVHEERLADLVGG